jgi:hypothetical protein
VILRQGQWRGPDLAICVMQMARSIILLAEHANRNLTIKHVF